MSSSFSTLKVFSPQSFVLPLSFLVSFSFAGVGFIGTLFLCSQIPDCSLTPIFFSAVCFSFSSFILFCSSTGSSFLPLGVLWFLVLNLLLFLSLSDFPLSLLCMHHICLVSFYSGCWLLLYILHIFSCFLSFGVICSRSRSLHNNYTPFYKVSVQSLQST